MKKIIALILAAMMLLSLAACGATQTGGNGDTAKTTYAIVCKDASNPYMLKMIDGFKTACEKLGVEFLTKSPETTSVDDQINIVNDLVAQGKSVVMISSEMPELLGMSDRIYVMNEGKFVGEFMQEEATQEKMMAAILKSKNN